MNSDPNIRVLRDSQIALAEHAVEFKSLDNKLSAINISLQTLINKLDSLQNQLNVTSSKVLEIETWKKVTGLDEKLETITDHSKTLAVLNEKLKDYDHLKSVVDGLQQGQTRFTVYVSVAVFVVSIASTVLVKILFH